MKKLILFFVFISLNTFAQRNINLGVGEEKTIEGGDWNISMNKDAILYIKGYVTINHINNFNDGATVNIDKDAVVQVKSSTNLNGNANLFIFGKFMTNGIEIQNGMNALNVQGHLQAFHDFQLNDGTSEVNVCGKVEVGNYTNWHSQSREKAVVFCNCAQWITWGLNNNRENVATGFGSIFYTKGNINKTISDAPTIYINRDCNPLAVEIESFDVRINKSGEVEYNLKLSEDSTTKTIIIQSSEDGKIWKEVIRREVKGDINNNFSGVIK